MIVAKNPFWCFAQQFKNIIDFNWKMATEKRVIENVENYFHELSLSQSCCLLQATFVIDFDMQFWSFL